MAKVAVANPGKHETIDPFKADAADAEPEVDLSPEAAAALDAAKGAGPSLIDRNRLQAIVERMRQKLVAKLNGDPNDTRMVAGAIPDRQGNMRKVPPVIVVEKTCAEIERDLMSHLEDSFNDTIDDFLEQGHESNWNLPADFFLTFFPLRGTLKVEPYTRAR